MWLLILCLVVLQFAITILVGAPYLPILRRDYGPLLDLVDLKPSQTIIDLGSGDGRFLRAAAQRGLHAIGYELNPVLYLISLVVTWRYRHLVRVYLADFWTVKLPATDAIYVFLLERFMAKLDAKLRQELVQPTPVVSFVFTIPDRRPAKQTRNSYLYQYPAGKP